MHTKPYFRSVWITLILGVLIIGQLFQVQAAPGQPAGSNSTITNSTVYLPLLLRNYPLTEVTFWYSYGTGSAEEYSLKTVLIRAAIDLPQYKITAVQVPYSNMHDNYVSAVQAGAGPDMFVFPNDWLGDDARAGYITDLSSLAAGRLGAYTPLSIQGMTVDGKLYGIPESLKAVALWYDKTRLAVPPATTSALASLMSAGTPIAVSYGCYHHWGFFGAFGGHVFDNNWKVDAVNPGMINAMTYLDDLYQVSKAHGWPRTDYDGLVPFTTGQVVAITNGNWAMGDYRNALGSKLGVAPLPAGPSGPATPMLGVDGYFINPNSLKKAAAVELALYLTNQAAEEEMMEAGHVPAIMTTITDPLILSILNIFLTTYVRPQVPQLGLYWTNFCDTDDVFEEGMDPATWLQIATNLSNP